MTYQNIIQGIFLERLNRFVAKVQIDGNKELCHVKNTGRLRELLYSGAVIYLQICDKCDRKTKFDLIAVEKGSKIVNVDSQVTNHVVYDWIKQGNFIKNVNILKREVSFGKSRFDLYAENDDGRHFIEVKGVTLEENGILRFPDAPSDRAVKHVNELCDVVKAGYQAYVVFVIQMQGARYFEPNDATHRKFGEALRYAVGQGVHVCGFDCTVEKDSIEIYDRVEIRL